MRNFAMNIITYIILIRETIVLHRPKLPADRRLLDITTVLLQKIDELKLSILSEKSTVTLSDLGSKMQNELAYDNGVSFYV